VESQKDKEAFEVWFYGIRNSQFAKFLRENFPEVGVRWDKESCRGAWQAALAYRDKQIELSHKGACPTCEPIGELNLKLSNELSEIKSKLSGIISGE